MNRWRRTGKWLVGGALFVAATAIVLVVVAAIVIRTDWARERLRALIVSQANRALDATLSLGGVNGSLLRGIELEGVTLSRDGEVMVAVERAHLTYGLLELFNQGTTIRSITLERPNIVLRQRANGRWNFSELIRRTGPPPSGPGRHIRIDAIALHDGRVSLHSPVSLGPAHVPADMTSVNAELAYETQSGSWTVNVSRLSFAGASPQLTLQSMQGEIASGDSGWSLRSLRVVTEKSELNVDGGVDRSSGASRLDFNILAARFDFQEWAGVLTGLSSIGVSSAFDLRMSGAPAALQTSVNLRSTGGDVKSEMVLDTTVPGWHGAGTATVQRVDLALWLSRPDRPSDISGNVVFDLDLLTPRRFPRGSFRFDGSHAGYLDYEADDVVARGNITDTDVLIGAATATAYGANVRLSESTIALDDPYAFRFRGVANGVDLRQVPRNVPVPHVESTLALDFDVTGRFAEPYIKGGATFAPSEFLGARLADGATGTIDTLAEPFRYSGQGDLSEVDLNRLGRGLSMNWLSDPRYDGTLSGHFRVEGSGSEAATMVLTGGGRLSEASLFNGRLFAADVGVSIAGGSIDGSFDGEFADIDPSIPSGLDAYRARLSGKGRGRLAVRDLLVRTPQLGDYSMDASLTAGPSEIRGIDVASGSALVSLADSTLHIERVTASGDSIELEGQGTLELDGLRSSRLEYRVARSDLSKLPQLVGAGRRGDVATTGTLTGPLDKLQLQGDATARSFGTADVDVSTGAAHYDVTLLPEAPDRSAGTATIQLSTVTAFGLVARSLAGDVAYDAGQVTAKLDASIRDDFTVGLDTAVNADVASRKLSVSRLALTTPQLAWQLASNSQPLFEWTESSLSVANLELVDSSSRQQHLAANGTWNTDGSGLMHLTANSVSIDTLALATGSVLPYAGLLNGTATLTGTRERPVVSSDFVVTGGRIERLTYERFGGHVDYADQVAKVDIRLDQSPGAWLTGVGSVPLSVFDRSRPAAPLQITVKSSQLSLGLLEGVSDLVREVGGSAELDVTIVGTSRDPHFTGRAELTNAAFQVRASGVRYRNGRVALSLASDRVGVDVLHLEDEDGHSLDVTGSLGTHELRVGDLRVAINARGFQVLRNEYGRVAIDGQLDLAGEFESPQLTGRLTITTGSIAVDRVLDRTLFQPYATTAAPALTLDPIVALNPWDRTRIDIEVHIPGTLRMTGDNVQVSPGTPLGLGNINLRVFGDLSLYKDPEQPLYVNGSLDSVTGSYSFQGRRFALDPASSINFRGDLNPELDVTVNREISGVETRVSILGLLNQPELRLASSPPLDPSDILSLIVFNTSTNDLSALQQQQLAVRAGTLAAGFIAAPMVSALERTLGIDTLEIEPGSDARGGPRVTVGDEIAPGLVARFSRQFGASEYDEATLEYYLSRIFRIRATFSDASTLTVSPFRRVERAGIDLLLFFSF